MAPWEIYFEGTNSIQLTFQRARKLMRELEKCLFEGTISTQTTSSAMFHATNLIWELENVPFVHMFARYKSIQRCMAPCVSNGRLQTAFVDLGL